MGASDDREAATATFYEILGVEARAPADELRRAYHRRARELHPDRGGDTGAAGAPTMRDLNEAWRTLGDPAARAAYDRALADAAARRVQAAPEPGPATVPGFSDPDVDLDPTPYVHRPVEPGDIGMQVVRALPWIVVVVVLVAVFVFTAYAGGDRSGVRGAVEVGDCVSVQPGLGVVEVGCEGPNDGQVAAVVTERRACPDGADPRQQPGSGRWLCLVAAPGR